MTSIYDKYKNQNAEPPSPCTNPFLERSAEIKILEVELEMKRLQLRKDILSDIYEEAKLAWKKVDPKNEINNSQ